MNRPQGQARLLLKFLQDYNIRSTDSDYEQKNIFMQTNFSGIMNIWSITTDDLFKYLVNGDKKAKKQSDDEDVEDEDVDTNEEENDDDDDNDGNLEEDSDTFVDQAE